MAGANAEDEFPSFTEENAVADQARTRRNSNPSSGKVTRTKLAHVISERIGLSHSLCDDVVFMFFDTIKHALIAGETVKIKNFATFSLRDKNARPGRNPKTGEEVEVSARRVVRFRPSRRLRNLVGDRAREIHNK